MEMCMGQTLQSPDPSLQQLLLARGAVHHGLNLSAGHAGAGFALGRQQDDPRS
jgi:hypothetical protein